MDYPKLISEKWNLTAKFNCLDGHYLMCHLHYVSRMCDEDLPRYPVESFLIKQDALRSYQPLQVVSSYDEQKKELQYISLRSAVVLTGRINNNMILSIISFHRAKCSGVFFGGGNGNLLGNYILV